MYRTSQDDIFRVYMNVMRLMGERMNSNKLKREGEKNNMVVSPVPAVCCGDEI